MSAEYYTLLVNIGKKKSVHCQGNRILNYPSRDREGAVRVDPGKTAPSLRTSFMTLHPEEEEKALASLHPDEGSRIESLNLKRKRKSGECDCPLSITNRGNLADYPVILCVVDADSRLCCCRGLRAGVR